MRIRYTLLILLFIHLGCADTPTANAPIEPPKLKVLELQPKTKTVYTEFAAVFEGKQSVEIRPKIAGYIDEIFFEEGQKVALGQRLFRLETESLSKNASAAMANVKLAQLEVDKLVPLVERNIISPIQLKTAQAKFELAQSNYESLIATINFSVIRSPVDGYAGNIRFKKGALVSNTTSEPLTVVSDISEIRAYFSMNEKQLLKLKKLQLEVNNSSLSEDITLVLADGSTYSYTGKIAMINSIIDPVTGSASLRADFPNPENQLYSGGSGRVRIPRTLKNIYVIPMTATVDLQGKKLIYILTESGLVKAETIEILEQTDTSYLVKSGINKGDRIVVEGVSKLKDGQAILIAK